MTQTRRSSKSYERVISCVTTPTYWSSSPDNNSKQLIERGVTTCVDTPTYWSSSPDNNSKIAELKDCHQLSVQNNGYLVVVLIDNNTYCIMLLYIKF
jgi:hypothetical protein